MRKPLEGILLKHSNVPEYRSQKFCHFGRRVGFCSGPLPYETSESACK